MLASEKYNIAKADHSHGVVPNLFGMEVCHQKIASSFSKYLKWPLRTKVYS